MVTRLAPAPISTSFRPATWSQSGLRRSVLPPADPSRNYDTDLERFRVDSLSTWSTAVSTRPRT
jgi:hypothetical protein